MGFCRENLNRYRRLRRRHPYIANGICWVGLAIAIAIMYGKDARAFTPNFTDGISASATANTSYLVAQASPSSTSPSANILPKTYLDQTNFPNTYVIYESATQTCTYCQGLNTSPACGIGGGFTTAGSCLTANGWDASTPSETIPETKNTFGQAVFFLAFPKLISFAVFCLAIFSVLFMLL